MLSAPLRPAPLRLLFLVLLAALGFSAGASVADPAEDPSVSPALHVPLPARDPADQGVAGLRAVPGITLQEVDNRSFQGFYKFLASGEYFMQQFQVPTKTEFNFLAAFPENADVAILAPAGVANFTQGRAFPAVAKFGNQPGIKFVTLKPGTYFLAARALNGGAGVSVKLDFQVELEAFSRTIRSDLLIDPVEPHHYLSQRFVVASDVRYFIDGCNTGMPFFIMTDGDYENYQAGRAFGIISSYTGDDPSFPGPWELGMSPGVYYLVFENGTDEPQPAAYFLEVWEPRLPAAPTNLTISENGGFHALDWVNHASNATKNLIERKIGDGKYGKFGSVSSNESHYRVVRRLRSGKLYTFRVRASNRSGSAYSNEVSVDLR